MKTPHSCEEGGQAPDYRRVCHLLRRMGVTPNYTGFHQAARAACEAARRPELMLSLSKWLYPLVAREMNTTGAAVERNIRTVILRAWRQNPELLRQCARFPLNKRPTCGEFLDMLAACLEGPQA
ncbi:MAG TPA: sporulation initiation factor Spo0A C-terminal domain-containing protein [Candidatus Lawsonibacter pullicola]|nr:sporulation initiation factor Spo0A C-terminal domain-containing protein [Candidatus Lawsonibacter pullicola]